MKKRSFRVLFVCLLMLAVGCFAAACKEKEHVHEYIDVVTPPTCTERGYTTHTCEADGENYTDSYVDALGHDWDEGTVTKEATCTAAGEKTFTCLRCDETRTEPIEPKGHTPGEAVRENEKAATCTEAGSYDEVVYCEVCKTELSREQVTVPTIAHTAGEAVRENEKAATCTAAGSYDEVVYCEVCKTELSRTQVTVPTIAHTAGVPVHENEKAATCTAAGSYDEVIYCTVCKEELSRTEMTVPTIAHTAGAPVRENEKAATCTEAGSYDEVVYCTMCETELSREQVTVPTIAHTEGEPVHENEKAATCTQAGSYDEVVYCTVCGTVISRTQVTVPTIAHTEGEPVHENEKAATCTEAGSYDEVVYCTVCGTVISRTQMTVPTIAHTEGEPVHENEVPATCTEVGSYDEVVYCEVCGTVISRTEKTIDALEHDLTYTAEVAATCEDAGTVEHWTCSNCNKYFADAEATEELTDLTIPAKGHDLTYTAEVAASCGDAGTVEHWTCSNCNKYFADADATEELASIIDPAKGHSWSTEWTSDDDNHWRVCTVCNAVDEATKAAHTYIEKVDDAYLVSAATCTKKAVYYKSCSVCGAKGTETFESGELAAHTAVTDPAVEPTCTAPGLTEGSHCSACGEVLEEQQEIEAKGHNFVGHVCSRCYAIEMVGVDGIDDGATVAVHDPSIIVAYADADGNLYPESADGRQKMYFIFGTQLAAAYSYDMESWLMFTPTFYAEKENEEDEGIVSTEYTKIFKSAAAWPGYTDSDTIKGNLWAPDIIYNEYLGEWCLYYSMSGDSNNFRSSVFMMTSKNLTGPYEFAGFVVFSGFNKGSGAGVDDYYAVTGGSSVPPRYSNDKNAWNNNYGVSCIDPNVLYDEKGELWLNYGSWSGGIFLIKLDKETGLRDKTFKYGTEPVYDGTALVSDPYLGYHIAGGYYVSGEGPYIAYMNGYYYLFLSYGFYSPEGGYNMRVFRSSTINGRYEDMNGNWAVYAGSNKENYGSDISHGEVLMQNYKWSWWTGTGYTAQGHNSVLVDGDKVYLIYHVKYDDGTAHHNVEVHELVFGENGWPLAAPFQKSKTDTIITDETVDLTGSWSVILHTPVDYKNLQVNTDKVITLNEEGTVTGDYTGTWVFDGNYIIITLIGETGSATLYTGVVMQQQIEGLEGENVAYTFTATSKDTNTPLWGVKNPEGQSAAESVLESLVLPGEIMASMNLPATGDFGTTISYSSDDAAVLSDTGVYTAPEADTEVTLTVTVTSGDYSVEKPFTIKVLSEASANALLANADGESVIPADFIVAKAAPLAGETVNAVSQIDASTGVSLTFRVENIGSDWDVIFRAPGKKAIVYLAVLNYQNADTYELSATISEAGAKILTDHGFTADTGNYWRLFLGSLCDNEDKSCIATISYNVDGSITFYRDGVLMLTYAATTKIGESTVGALSKYMAEQVGSVGLEVVWPVEDLIIGYAVDYKPCEHIYGAYDGDTATCTLCGATKVKVSAGDKTYEAEFVSRERAEEVANTDEDGNAWWGTVVGQKSFIGDFAVQYTWINSRDANYYSNVALELYQGTTPFTMNMLNGSAAWGDLTIGTTHAGTVTKDGVVATPPAVTAAAGFDCLGDYKASIMRIGSTLIIRQTVELNSGVVWEAIDTFSNFTTAVVTVNLNGNPFWADDIRVAVGTISEVTQTTETVEVNQRFDSPTVWTTWYEVPVSFAYGQTLTVWGTQEGTVTENWFTTLWEIREGFTGRCDAYGWTFDPLDTTTKFGTYSVVSTALNGQATTFGDNEWAEYRDIAKMCEYTFTFSWSETDALTVIILLENEKSTYQCVYMLPIIDSTVTEFNVHLTAEDVANFTVDSYSITK